jgi:uncharacterized protein YkwD
MMSRNFFDHTNPDGLAPYDRMRAAGYKGSSYGENIAKGQRTCEEVMQGWMDSPGHRANILNPSFATIGIGIAGDCWVQDFGGR